MYHLTLINMIITLTILAILNLIICIFVYDKRDWKVYLQMTAGLLFGVFIVIYETIVGLIKALNRVFQIDFYIFYLFNAFNNMPPHQVDYLRNSVAKKQEKGDKMTWQEKHYCKCAAKILKKYPIK